MGTLNSLEAMELNNTLIFLCFLYFFLVPRCGIAVSNSTITSARYLRDGEIITSEDGSFNLGFFSPGNSTKRYVGIWFAKVVTQTIVWVANRETPLMDSSGVLKMGDDGNLVVLDGKEKIVWSSYARTTGNTSIGELLNSGNLIIREQESSSSSQAVQWESFDHPTDTFLAGMKFGLNLRTGENQLLTAWKNANDPAPGNFSLGFDPNKIAQIIIWNSSERYWRSGQWNGQLLTGVPEMTSFFLYGFNILTDTEEGRLYCTYSNTNKSIISSFLLSPTGNLERLYWNDMALGWDVSWSQPNSECQIYGQCGPYGSCNRKHKPICRCLPGFRPSVTEQWNSGNWSSGCVRNYQLECKDGNSVNTGFMELSGMKLPDFSYVVHAVQSRVDCHKSCERNCSCVAYSYDSGLGCLTWNDRLLDIAKFDDGGQVLYLRLNKASFKSRRKAKILLLVIILMIAGGLGMLVIYAVHKCMKIKRLIASQRSIAIEDFNLLDFGIQPNSNRHFLDANELEKSFNKGKSPDLPIFSLEVVRTATKDFSIANKLGEGGFGPVYKGKLPSGQDIAVKRLSKSSGQGLLEFENEVIVIAKLQHRNLVRLLGCCSKGEEKMLIYEYMPNKSLDFFLFDPTKQAALDWKKRFYIIEGIARGLLYLHRDSRLRIIHRDLKASNILLDGNMNPKISDFGMARIFGGNQNQANTMRVVGTYGYLAPEYAMEGLFSVKSDVFSFGVLLLEIVSGRRNVNFNYLGKTLNLLGYAWELWSENKLVELLDPSHSLNSTAQVLRCIQVGLLCVQDSAVDRPTMDSVVFMLGTAAAVLPLPKKPAFSTGRTPPESGLLSYSSEVHSVNDVTISAVFGR